MKFRTLAASALALLMPVSALAAPIQVIIDGKTVVMKDVQSETWFAAYVRDAAELGIVTGYKDQYGEPTGRFGPSNTITVAEALKIAVEGAGYNEEEYARKVPSGVDHWASAYVSVAKGENFPVIQDRMNLDRAATRAEVSAMLAAAFGLDVSNVVIGTRYKDVDAETQYAASVEALSNDKVVAGDTDAQGQAVGTFRPTYTINRAEVAKMIMSARGTYGTPGSDKLPDEQAETNLVTYTNTGFTPTVLRVKKGTTVTFRNDSSADLWVASDPHPTHTGLPGFDAGNGIGQGETYTFTFVRLGTFGYHNHLKTSDTATIVVEE
jgi:plastocyanin